MRSLYIVARLATEVVLLLKLGVTERSEHLKKRISRFFEGMPCSGIL
jgi:hypothetical protein